MIQLLNFSGMYEGYEIGELEDAQVFNMRDVRGTKLYVEAQAESEIRERIKTEGSALFHLIDIGDYHYVTRLYLYDIRKSFDLLVFDHHDDMREPEFEGLRSCGSWLKDAIDDLADTLLSVRLIRSEQDIRDIKGKPDKKRPLYISIDKDILSEEACPTNWDQGDMELSTLLKLLKRETEGRKLIGIDICGGLAGNDISDNTGIRKNQSVDMAIIASLCYNS